MRERLETISYCTKSQGVPARVIARMFVLCILSFRQFSPSPSAAFSVNWKHTFVKTKYMELTVFCDLMFGGGKL